MKQEKIAEAFSCVLFLTADLEAADSADSACSAAAAAAAAFFRTSVSISVQRHSVQLGD